MKANDDSLVSYDEVEDNSVKLNEVSTMGANLNMNSNKVTNIGTATSGGDALNKTYADTKLPESGGTMTGNLNMGSNKITGLPQTTQNGDAVDFEFFNKNTPLGGRDSYGNLFCSLKALYRVVTITNERSSVTTVGWVNNRFISKAGGTMTGNLNAANNKIINLGDATDAISKKFFDQSHIKPTRKTDEFKYVMQNKLEWTDMYGSSCNMVKIADLLQHDGNPHDYNYKVIYTRPLTKTQMGTLITNLGDNALCIEFLNTDYQLWHVVSVDKTTSQGLTIGDSISRKFSHKYTTSSGRG